MRQEFSISEGEIPSFDIVILDLSADGHIAGLSPHSNALYERNKLVVAQFIEKLGAHVVTLTLPVLLAAKDIIVLAFGYDKAEIVATVLEGDYEPEKYPAQFLRHANGRVTWFVDKAAASKLKHKYTDVYD